ncbi:MAG: regulatory protein GemA [Treponema sp.]|jgi:phage gp16-like protein|nr:regulatory protein GemA [Treponema sp.]
MRSVTSENKRKKLIQLIHVGKSKMGMDEDMYRAFLTGVCGRDSAAKMTVRQLEQALKAMRNNGFVQLLNRVNPLEKGRATLEQLEYIKGMWAVCARNKSEAALAAFVKRVGGVDALRFLNVELAQKVILALRDMMLKAGFDPDTSEAVHEKPE